MASVDVKPARSAKSRLQRLRQLLSAEGVRTQEELRTQLEKLDFTVNQSTISRDLRRIGAIKVLDAEGRANYRLAVEPAATGFSGSLADLVRGIYQNGAMVVVNTDPGSASLIARHIDGLRSEDVLGTIAGDDTIFIAPTSLRRLSALARQIETSLANTGL